MAKWVMIGTGGYRVERVMKPAPAWSSRWWAGTDSGGMEQDGGAWMNGVHDVPDKKGGKRNYNSRHLDVSLRLVRGTLHWKGADWVGMGCRRGTQGSSPR
jgi:hypothetical protein